mmetsp:Transcript_62228/g.74891  ORF Transcript_62228/g.74891 Transcript_62228/m.74891 type:complete len:101 (+) Transcript_62228:29-331(+)
MTLNYERGDLGGLTVTETTCGLFEAKRTTRGRKQTFAAEFFCLAGFGFCIDPKFRRKEKTFRQDGGKKFQQKIEGDGVDTDWPFTEVKATFWDCIRREYR